MKTRPRQLWLDCLILAIPFKSHILFKSRALCLSLLSQNRRLSISLLSILRPLLKPALPSYTIFFISLPPSPPPPSLTFYGPPPPSSARFCNTRICLNMFFGCFIRLFTCSSPCCTDQFVALYFTHIVIVQIQVYNCEIRYHSTVCRCGVANI